MNLDELEYMQMLAREKAVADRVKSMFFRFKELTTDNKSNVINVDFKNKVRKSNRG